MIETIKEAEVGEASFKGAKVASYGIVSTLPKASGETSGPVFYEVHRHMQYGGIPIVHYRRKVSEVQKRILFVKGDIKDLGYNVVQILSSGENHNYVQS